MPPTKPKKPHADKPAAKKDRPKIRDREDVARVCGRVGNFRRTLKQAEADHGVNFFHEILEIKRRFPKEHLEILDEGCGESSVAQELIQKGVDVTTSDLFPRGINAGAKPVSVHGLAEYFGENKFHMIISTRGGVDWRTNSEDAITNVFAVLKPGGKAFITVTTTANTKKAVEKLGIRHTLNGNRLVLFKQSRQLGNLEIRGNRPLKK